MKRVPADWEPQRAVWFAWPHNRQTWPHRFDRIPDCFRRIINLSAEVVPVNVIGGDELRATSRIDTPDNVRWHKIITDDCWIRDYGPTFVFDDEQGHHAIDWRYNAWGGKYPPWDSDDAATERIIESAGWSRVEGTLTLEGGALEWDGGGRLLTTGGCLETPTRNPGISRDDIRQRLESLTGTREIVWVDGGGLAGDDTDGHIDQLARFVDPQTVVVAACDDRDDPNHAGLGRNHQILYHWAEMTSPRVELHRLPIPPARLIDGRRVPESYCNFLRLGNDRLLVPTFGHAPSDSFAVGLIGDLVRKTAPQIEVIGVDCRDLVWGLGALHCASCNEPALPGL